MAKSKGFGCSSFIFLFIAGVVAYYMLIKPGAGNTYQEVVLQKKITEKPNPKPKKVTPPKKKVKKTKKVAPPKRKKLKYAIQVDRTPEAQAKRKELIQKLIDEENVLEKFEFRGSYPYIWVKNGFFTLEPRHQLSFIEMVYAYAMTADETFGYSLAGGLYADLLSIKVDNGRINGKTVGSYDPIRGLRMK